MVAVVVWYASIHDVDDAGGVQQNEEESVDVVADAGAATVRDYGFQHERDGDSTLALVLTDVCGVLGDGAFEI